MTSAKILAALTITFTVTMIELTNSEETEGFWGKWPHGFGSKRGHFKRMIPPSFGHIGSFHKHGTKDGQKDDVGVISDVYGSERDQASRFEDPERDGYISSGRSRVMMNDNDDYYKR